VTIELDDGRVLRSRRTAFRGHHTMRATQDRVPEIRLSGGTGVLPSDQHAALRSTILSLEELGDLQPFWNAARAPRRAAGSS